MTPTTDDRPTLNLGHLCIPNVSASREWLKRQGEQRAKAVEIAASEARKWLGLDLPEDVYTGLAERIVTALDHQV
jgi:cell division inhibitor SulA